MTETHHQMNLICTREGFDEFFCPVCARRILLRWPPDYEKIVLDVGDDYIIHSFGGGGLDVANVDIASHDSKLDVYADFLRSIE